MNSHKKIIFVITIIIILLFIFLLKKKESKNNNIEHFFNEQVEGIQVKKPLEMDDLSIDFRLNNNKLIPTEESYFYKNFFIDKSIELKNKSSNKCKVNYVSKVFKGVNTIKKINYSVINLEFKNNSIEFKKGLIHMGLMSMFTYYDTINSIFQDDSNFVNLQKRINLDNGEKNEDYLSNENFREEINDFYQFIKEKFKDCITEENSYLDIFYDINLKNHIIVNSVFTKTEKENDMIDINYTSKFFILNHNGYIDISSDKKINTDKLVIRLFSNYKSGKQLFNQILYNFLEFEQSIDKDHITNIQDFLKKMKNSKKSIDDLKSYLNNYKKSLDKNNTISYWFFHIINNFLVDIIELETKEDLIENFANPECKDKTLNDGSEYVDNNINPDLAFTCKDYEDNGMCIDGKTTDKYIKVTNNIDNMEAKDACCVCGGGINENERVNRGPTTSDLSLNLLGVRGINENERVNRGPTTSDLSLNPLSEEETTQNEGVNRGLTTSDLSLNPLSEEETTQNEGVNRGLTTSDLSLNLLGVRGINENERVNRGPTTSDLELNPLSEEQNKNSTIKVANTSETKMKIKNIIKNILPVEKNEININQEGNDIVIKIEDIDITNEVYTKIIPRIKDFYYLHYKKLYKLSKNENYNLPKNNIIINAYEGSIILVVKIFRNQNQISFLTDEEKDLFEYYNYVRVFHKGIRPFTLFELKQKIMSKY